MKAVIWNELGAQPALRDDVPAPRPGAGDVLVRVHASSVNPVDNAIAAGMVHTRGKIGLRIA
jgi:NADPH2:quinone reductase